MMRALRMTLALLLAALAGGAGAAPPALTGYLTDAVTGAAVADGIVTIGDRETRLGTRGAFRIDGTPGQILVRAPGYRQAALSGADFARSGGVVKLTPFTPRALYLTVYGVASQKLLGGALSIIGAGGANALVVDMKGDRGIVPYPSTVALTASAGARKVTTIPDLPTWVQRMHAAKIYLIARIVVFKDDPLATAQPDLAIKRANGELFRNGEGLAWTDPFRPEVRAYNIDLAVEAARAGFDEIQFDYLRFPDSSARLTLSQPSTQANRVAAIAGFLAEARQRLVPFNVFTSADIFGYVCWNSDDTGIGQHLEDIAPNVDYLAPMLYPSGFRFGIPGHRNPVENSYAIVRDSLAEAQRRLGVSPRRFRPWLQSFTDYAFDRRPFDADEVDNQIRAAADFGADGWMLWNARNTYDNAGLARKDAKR